MLAFLAFGLLWLTVPPADQTLAIAGLSAPVDISIDGNGVPRIHAANESDAATALGYMHARDRMFQMELMRRAASGRLSELVGPQTLGIDKQMRVLGLGRLAEGDVVAQSPEARALLEAYATGVNAWIASRGRFSGLEFLFLGAPEPWRPADSLMWGRTMGLWLSSNYRTELSRQALRDKVPRQLLEQLWPTPPPPLRPEASGTDRCDHRRSAFRRGGPRGAGRTTPFPAPFTLPSTASNAWAVDGRHSNTGAPLLAGDPHLGFSFPGLWYLVRIETPGHVLAGATGPGVPFLIIGRNEQIAWTFTTTGADTQDVYLEPPEAAFTSREERIKVRGAPDVVLTVRETRHGPVISDLNRAARARSWRSHGKSRAGRYGRHWPVGPEPCAHGRGSWQSRALIMSPVQNLMVADPVKIGLFVTGRVPVRRHGDGWAPVPGMTGQAMPPDERGDWNRRPGPAECRRPAPVRVVPVRPAPVGSLPSGAGCQWGRCHWGRCHWRRMDRAVAHGSVPIGPAAMDRRRMGRRRMDRRRMGSAPVRLGARWVGTEWVGSPCRAAPMRVRSGAATDDDAYGWSGFASGDALPHVIAPASGRLVNAQ